MCTDALLNAGTQGGLLSHKEHTAVSVTATGTRLRRISV